MSQVGWDGTDPASLPSADYGPLLCAGKAGSGAQKGAVLSGARSFLRPRYHAASSDVGSAISIQLLLFY